MSHLKTLNYEYIFSLSPLVQDRYVRKTGDNTKTNLTTPYKEMETDNLILI